MGSSGNGHNGTVTVITGASSGIGAEAAKLFARRGDTVVLAARRAERLEAVADEIAAAGGEALCKTVDLAEAGQGRALIEWTAEECGRLDVLVNNAGFGLQVQLEEMDPEVIERMFRVNVLSLIESCRAAVPLLRRNAQGGSIINVASVGGVVGHPLNAVYCASKHAVVGFSKSLRLELWGTGINVVAFCPGGTKTEFFERALDEIPFDPMLLRYRADADAVAAKLVAATASRRKIIFPNVGAWFLAWADHYLTPISEGGNIRYRDRVLAAWRDKAG